MAPDMFETAEDKDADIRSYLQDIVEECGELIWRKKIKSFALQSKTVRFEVNRDVNFSYSDGYCGSGSDGGRSSLLYSVGLTIGSLLN